MGRKRSNNQDSHRYDDWLNAAYDDLRAAKALAPDNTLNNATAFHCQQCVEKAIKGFILFQTGNAVDGHSLTWLCRRAVTMDKRFYQWMDESATLNKYYIETRYPTDIPTEIEDSTIPGLVGMAEDVFDYIVDKIGVRDRLELWEAY
ncbi:MAG: HEPN domain-containing protein [Oscillospiraceae bacterium]|nr:HEPN domain-containing protein [Oscillospiraceae bacterium]